MIERLRDWWHARLNITGGTATVEAVVRPGSYEIWIGGTCYSYKPRWWDTRRSIARKLNRLING